MPAVYPVAWVPASFRGTYPHMAKRDAAAWAKYLAAHGREYEAFAYDVALGGVRVAFDGAAEASVAGYQYATALKIDAVGLLADRVVLFEVRPEAQCSSIGAALCYTLVAQREAVFELPIEPAIVCEYMQPDVAWVAEQLKVAVHRVGA